MRYIPIIFHIYFTEQNQENMFEINIYGIGIGI